MTDQNLRALWWIIILWLCVCLITMSYFVVDWFMPLHLGPQHESLQASSIAALYASPMILITMALRYFYKERNPKRLMKIAFVIIIISIVMLTTTQSMELISIVTGSKQY
jgi:peptidoglycan biosynthesis protein MviN/MurJ (putative lipid II flippase)